MLGFILFALIGIGFIIYVVGLFLRFFWKEYVRKRSVLQYGKKKGA